MRLGNPRCSAAIHGSRAVRTPGQRLMRVMRRVGRWTRKMSSCAGWSILAEAETGNFARKQ